jgi:hypothetical protein
MYHPEVDVQEVRFFSSLCVHGTQHDIHRDEDKSQDVPPIPPELNQKRCVWGYELNDELFESFEKENPEWKTLEWPPPEWSSTSRRIAWMRQLSEDIGIQHQLKLWIIGGKHEDRYIAYWTKHPSVRTYTKATVPCEELLEGMKERLRFDRREQWIEIPSSKKP